MEVGGCWLGCVCGDRQSGAHCGNSKFFQMNSVPGVYERFALPKTFESRELTIV